MKNLFVKSLSFSVMALLAGLFVSCGPQVTPEPDDPDKPIVDPTDSTVVEKPYVGDFALEVKKVDIFLRRKINKRHVTRGVRQVF